MLAIGIALRERRAREENGTRVLRYPGVLRGVFVAQLLAFVCLELHPAFGVVRRIAWNDIERVRWSPFRGRWILEGRDGTVRVQAGSQERRLSHRSCARGSPPTGSIRTPRRGSAA